MTLISIDVQYEEPVVIPSQLLEKNHVIVGMGRSAEDPNIKLYSLRVVDEELVLVRIAAGRTDDT